jgi:type IV pilus assembly protein PilV
MSSGARFPRRGAQAGFSMLEILISILIMVVGMLGFIGLQARSQVAEVEAYQRGQALILVQDMVDRLNTNRKAAGCYAITTSASTGSPALGTGYAGTPTCTALVGTTATRAIASQDLQDWNNELNGTTERLGGNPVGTILGARGCVTYDATTQQYRIAVAWQGLVPTVAPTTANAAATCGLNQYGNDAQRREVSATLLIANLN